MNMIGVPLILVFLLAADAKPVPKFPVGKETTYVTGPLDKEGYIDYEAALNDRLGKGITPDKNANVLLWKALGPTPEGSEGMPAEFFKRLGIQEPPRNGAYFIGLGAYMKDHLKLAIDKRGAIFDQQDRARLRPWSAKDYPHIAGWLKVNEKPLAVVIEATKRPDYFNPLVSRRNEKEPGSVPGALFASFSVQRCRELASALAARAMLRVAEGKFDEAWQNLLACHRLGGLVARGATLIEALVGIAIDQIASTGELSYLERADLTSKQVQDRLKDLQGLPPMSPMADKIDLAERFLFLDSLQLIRRGGAGTLEARKALEKIDWEPALRNGNRWYDRMAAALRLKGRSERNKALDKIEEDLKGLKKEVEGLADKIEENLKPPKNDVAGLAYLAKLILGKDARAKMTGKAIGDLLIGLWVPAARKLQNAYDRVEQVRRNLHVAFALTAYHADHGRYPAKLGDLAPKYLAAVPNDLFSGKPLVYRPAEKGYLFYSVGINGKDEGGRWYDDEPPGDDLGVRMPLPELKQKK